MHDSRNIHVVVVIENSGIKDETQLVERKCQQQTMPTLQGTTRVPPPPGVVADLKLPLSLFDIWWVHVQPTRRLLFYDHPCSTANFLDNIVPQLKQSLSLTLKHYLPAAGNLLYPCGINQKPFFRYVAGDSVSFTINESSHDFDEITANHARDADQFYDFVPPIPPITDEPGFKIVPLLAVQVTLFPGRGICVGVANHHGLADARSIVGFMFAWASINKLGGDRDFVLEHAQSLPIFDRALIKDSAGIDTIFWNAVKQIPFNPSSSFPRPTNRVRSTFILRQSDVNKLKNLVSAKNPSVAPASTFVVATAYAWACLARSEDAIGEIINDNTTQVFIFSADARGRLNAMINPPVPENYFGNCLGGGMASLEHKNLAGPEGFLAAAEAIAEQIKSKVYDKDEFLKGAENWPAGMQKYMGMKSFWVTDSPKFDLYGTDFGWGKAKKVEIVSIDGDTYSMSLCNSRDSDGGLEIGMSLPKGRMRAFEAIFADSLN